MKRKKSSRRSLSNQTARVSGGADVAAEQAVESIHTPVLLVEVVSFLKPQRGGIFVDCTLGMGGHAEAILSTSEDAQVIGIDRDLQAVEKASARLEKFGARFRAVHANFREIKAILASLKIEQVAGVLADLGVSSWQLDAPERGFSFRFDAPLDMRMNADSNEATAADLLATLPEEEIARIIYEYGEERFSRRIARRIVEKRANGELVATTAQLAETVEKSVKRNWSDRIHPATRTFQALRIAVNKELDGLDAFLGDAVDVLEVSGSLAVISFHSLEDRIVKKTFRRLAGVCECPPRLPICQCGAARKVEILTARPIIATEMEMTINPRARSAKLRVCERIKSE